MPDFGPDLYGEPCRQCGFTWTISAPDAAASIAAAPARYRALLADATGDERPPDATWTVAGYTLHAADNLRIWAERLVALAAGMRRIAPYDQDELAAVRNYDAQSLPVALWSLDRAAGDWAAAWALVADRDELTLPHPEMGEQPMRGVIGLVAHDTEHHRWDVECAVSGQNGRGSSGGAG